MGRVRQEWSANGSTPTRWIVDHLDGRETSYDHPIPAHMAAWRDGLDYEPTEWEVRGKQAALLIEMGPRQVKKRKGTIVIELTEGDWRLVHVVCDQTARGLLADTSVYRLVLKRILSRLDDWGRLTSEAIPNLIAEARDLVDNGR